jgi:tetratricopeptide (TPR) repeat protein
LADRASERERFNIGYRYYQLVLGDLDRALETMTLSRQIYPRDARTRENLAGAYMAKGLFENALVEQRESLKLSTGNLARLNLARILISLNRYQEAKTILKDSLSEKREVLGTHSALYQIAFIEADEPAMIGETGWAKGRVEENRMLFNQARAAVYQGKIKDSRQLFDRAVELAKQNLDSETAANYLSNQAVFETILGQQREAIHAGERALELSRSDGVIGAVALAFAHGGASDKTKVLIAEIEKNFPHSTYQRIIWLPAAQAVLHIRGGNGEHAIGLLVAAHAYEPGPLGLWTIYLRGLAYLQSKRTIEAAGEFQKVIDHRGVEPLSALYPLSHLGMARAHALAGDKQKAREKYSAFLAMWKDADADLPMLVDARREFGALN